MHKFIHHLKHWFRICKGRISIVQNSKWNLYHLGVIWVNSNMFVLHYVLAQLLQQIQIWDTLNKQYSKLIKNK